MTMRKRHTPEQVVRKLTQADRLLGEGKDVADVCRELQVSEQTYYRWRNQFGGLKADEAETDTNVMVMLLQALGGDAFEHPQAVDAALEAYTAKRPDGPARHHRGRGPHGPPDVSRRSARRAVRPRHGPALVRQRCRKSAGPASPQGPAR